MTQTPTEVLSEPVIDALHTAIGEAWRAGYECALMDNGLKTEEHYLSVVKEGK
jgi:hypothetical protein